MSSIQRSTDDYRLSHTGRQKAEAYDRRFAMNPHRAMMWMLERETIDTIVRRFFSGHVGSYLDFACGTGRIIAHIERYADYSAGVDVSAEMLDVARSRATKAELIECDLTRKPCLGQRSFQLITAFRFFPNAQPELRKEAMGVLLSLLERGGYLVFNNHLNSSSSMLRVARLLRASRGLGMSQQAVAAMVDGAGLKIVAQYHLGAAPANERVMLLPRVVLEPFERFAAKHDVFRSWSQNIIYVCQKVA